MLLIYFIHWLLLYNPNTSAENANEGKIDNPKSKPVRREWPDIKFEDFYPMYPNSGDGPIDENITETYIWTTIVTQIKATVFPTITRIKARTPKPPQIFMSSTLVKTCHSVWSQYSSNLWSQPLLPEDSLQSDLSRSSYQYLGPSSSIDIIMASSDLSLASFSRSFIGLSLESIIPSKSLIDDISSDLPLSEHLLTTDKHILSSSFERQFNSYSTLGIESSFRIEDNTLSMTASPVVETPIYTSLSIDWSPVVVSKGDKNSISSENPLSLWPSFSADNSHSIDNPFMTYSIQTSLQFTSDVLLTTASLKTLQTMTDPMKTTTINELQSQSVTISSPLPTTPTPLPLSPDCDQHYRQLKENATEYHLVRTVLNNTSEESIESIRSRIVSNITEILKFALNNSYTTSSGNRIGRNLLSSKLNDPNIEVEIWGINTLDSNVIQVIYSVRKDGILYLYQDIENILRFIKDDKYSEMIGFNVIEKVTPYHIIKKAKLEINLLAIILISCSAIVLIICIIMGSIVLCKYRSERRKWRQWRDAFHSQINRVVPDSQIHWRTVSQHMDPKTSDANTTQLKQKVIDNINNKDNEFQYLRFESNNQKQTKQMSADEMNKDDEQRLKKANKTRRKSVASRGTQSESNSLELEKQKVIPIADIITDRYTTDGNDNRKKLKSSHNEYMGTTFVTTKEIETDGNIDRSMASSIDSNIPQIISVQMSSQTESIIRAIRSELNKFGPNSAPNDNAFPYIDDYLHDTYTDESIISNSSEA